MLKQRILVFVISCLVCLHTHIQAQDLSIAEADGQSLALFNKGDWKGLVSYGNEQLKNKIDFPLLRMRMGYAAYMQGNFSQSLIQYKKVWKEDKTNETALYYVYLNNLYLNNTNEATFYAGNLSKASIPNKKSAVRISCIETEFGIKIPSNNFRKNANYFRLGLNIQLGKYIELQQSGMFYGQNISERDIVGVKNNNNISINQGEYYAKMTTVLGGNVSLVGGLHYLNTSFNNLIYNNIIGFGGIKLTTPYLHVKAMANFANISGNNYTQFDAVLSLYPLGNTKFYAISKAYLGNSFVFSQVAGVSLSKKIWLEGLVMLGAYDVLLNNDALYVYNDIDTKKFSAGGSLYASLGKKTIFSINYTFDDKTKFNTTNNNFYQQSITGGLKWTF